MPQQQPLPQPGFEESNSAAGAAAKQHQRSPPPGFEESMAGSKWLHAVKMAGLTEGQDPCQPAEEGQDAQQAWADAQPVAMVWL